MRDRLTTRTALALVGDAVRNPRRALRFVGRRLLGRRGSYWRIGTPLLYSQWESLVPPRELWVGRGDPFVHFVRWTFEYRAYLPLLCGLRRDSSVLELGCNHGRTMLGLVDYLRPPGRYEGLDILSPHVTFAQHYVRATNPICNFTVADVHNGMYNPDGKIRPEDFRFPYPDGSFDVIYAASLFTHLLPDATANYLRESRRVLRMGGSCLFSFLLLDDYERRGPKAWYRFDHSLDGFDGVAVYSRDDPERIISYHSDVVRRLARDAGLEIERIVPGLWSDMHPLTVNEHDLIVVRRAEP